jgi:hypothetical protein
MRAAIDGLSTRRRRRLVVELDGVALRLRRRGLLAAAAALLCFGRRGREQGERRRYEEHARHGFPHRELRTSDGRPIAINQGGQMIRGLV